MRRLRARGYIPAVLYGHHQDSVSLAVPEKDLMAVLRHSGHLVQLDGAVSDSALIKHVMWDEVAASVLHVDFARVDASEEVDIELTVELRGTAKGTSQGGVINHVIHSVEIRCPANMIPEKLELKIADLEVGQALRAKDIPLPNGAQLLENPDSIVVQCVTVAEEAEPTAEPGAPAEPELIGRKKEDEEGEE